MNNVVITGSTQGVGFALAREFRRRGAGVVVTGRRQSSVDEAAERLRQEPGSGTVVGRTVDVSDPESPVALWEAAIDALGHVDIWVNNAGYAHTTTPIVDTPTDAVRTMVETNMLGTIFGAQAAVRGMSAQGSGKVFNVLGGGSDGKVRPNMGVYGSTKRGLDLFTRALAKEVEGTGVSVGQVRPGILITEGWLREAAADPESVRSQRRILNILTDHVDDVAPELVARMLASTKNGDEIAWLTTSRIARRFMTPGISRKRDVLARYGL
ncbi:SDR family oxidoreductase [Nocardioides alcanivorans]|uniref:SDR family oxidoreductase n=1 Tax=Nocardioides alcanivorans TaxID=2897352 RepID=UPI001F29BF7E|nr:SDR family oxidoreductase [Nocardioides alcanivorans]